MSQVKAQSAEVVHVVKAGETLAQIAGRYGISYIVLANYNGISNPNVIRVGQRLRIPRSSARTPVPAPVRAPTPASASATAPTPIQSQVAVPTRQVSSPEPQMAPTPTRDQPKVLRSNCGSEITYSVRRGDSLYGIGAYYNVSAQTIIARNNLPSTLIYVGQRLFIPLPGC